MGRRGRFGVIVTLAALAWAGTTFLLNSDIYDGELPLVTMRFSSWYALLWLVGFVCVVLLLYRLVTLRRPREEWLVRYETAFSYVTDGVMICSARGKVYWRNEAAMTYEGDGGALPNGVLPMIDRAAITRKVAVQTLTFSEGGRVTTQVVPLDRRTFAVILRPLTDANRNTFYENFIRRIVHDMRNPLAAIIGHAANMHQNPTLDADIARNTAHTIDEQAQRLARLVDSLLFDARLAYVPLSARPLDLVDVLEEAVYAHDEPAQRDGKSIEMELPSQPMRFEGDRDLLARAFENLVANSLKYSGVDGRLCVTLEQTPSAYVIQFIDNGEGIPPEYLPDRIFEPLVRVRPSEGGSGLGLSIARKIFEMHGGTIQAHSRLGEGTTMTIRLPVTP
jgi:signal transduction histidine kinase